MVNLDVEKEINPIIQIQPLYAGKKIAKMRPIGGVLVGKTQAPIVKAPQIQEDKGAAARRSSRRPDKHYLIVDKDQT